MTKGTSSIKRGLWAFLIPGGLAMWFLIFWGLSYAFSSNVITPPKRYDHTPRQPVLVKQFSFGKLREICWTVAGYQADACVLPNWYGKCIVYMPEQKTTSRPYWNALYQHEQAHCNGWPNHHPR